MVVREVVPALAGRAYARIGDWGLVIGEVFLTERSQRVRISDQRLVIRE